MEISSQRITEAAIAAAARVHSITSEKTKADTETAKPKLADARQEISLDVNDARPITQTLNKFFQSMNADLHFEIHEDTQRMIVQLVNTAEQKVLKEFPPRDFLDMVAKIRDYVGAILDKRA